MRSRARLARPGRSAMKEPDLRVEAVRLQGRAAIVAEHGVQKREERVDAVEGRAPRAAPEGEGRIVHAHEMSRRRRNRPAPPRPRARAGRRRRGRRGCGGRHRSGGARRPRARRAPPARIASAWSRSARRTTARWFAALAATTPRTITVLRAGSSATRNCARRSSTLPVRGPSTRAKKRPFGARSETVTPASAQAASSAGEAPARPKTHDAVEHVQRRAAALGAVDLDHEILAVLAQPGVLAGDVDGVEHAAHGRASSRQAAPPASARRAAASRAAAAGTARRASSAAGGGAQRRRRAPGGDHGARPRRPSRR